MLYYSPLRYPGGKSKLSDYIKLILTKNYLVDGHYVEPYAGGASIALDLVMNEFVSVAHINDIDKSIYCFWESVLNNTDNLCKKIIDTKVTIEEWHIQKDIQKNYNQYSSLELGYSTFFLNRTNRSGILNAGVIGGQTQSGSWKIDARFNKPDLIKRIEMIAKYKNRINLTNYDAAKFIERIISKKYRKIFLYLDPPYYNKGKQLYMNYYTHDDHNAIATLMMSLKDKNWIISYDDHPSIKKFYRDYRQKIYSLNYSINSPAIGKEVIIFSKNIQIPDVDNPSDKIEINNYMNMEYS